MNFKTTIGAIAPAAKGEQSYVNRIKDQVLDIEEGVFLKQEADYIGVTKNFKEVIDYFKVPAGELPAGFRLELELDKDNVLRGDLVRDISYDKNNMLRPTNVLFSADSSNPYEVAPIKNVIANLTCNPAIIYDKFINNPKANVGNKFKTRDEVMKEIGNILGPGADISVEFNDPFGKSEKALLEEAEKFREMLSKYRVVIKVPHMGPINKKNCGQFLKGDKRLKTAYDDVLAEDAFRCHNLALMLKEHGFRVNFTLMFEPHQTALALQARPYFINSFIRSRYQETAAFDNLLASYEVTGNEKYLEEIKNVMLKNDYFAPGAEDAISLNEIRDKAEFIVASRQFDSEEGNDGLDAVRHNLRWLRNTNMDDTRLIICSMGGDKMYQDIDRLLVSDEFEDMQRRVVITAEPNYLARFTSTPLVLNYQRKFVNAANGEK